METERERKIREVAELLWKKKEEIYETLDPKKFQNITTEYSQVKSAKQNHLESINSSEINRGGWKESEKIQRETLAEWKELALKMGRKATISKEAKEAHDTAPKNSEVKEIILARWNDLSSKMKQRIAAITRVEEAEEACYTLPVGNAAKEQAVAKQGELALKMVQEATTSKEAEKAEKACYTLPVGNAVKEQAVAKREELALKMVQEASTIEEIKDAYFIVPKNSEARKQAIKKLLQLV